MMFRARDERVRMTSEAGFTLLEVVIAVLVLAVGILGAMAVQTMGFNNNQNAYFRSQATLIANDMADRMRANPDGVSAGSYSNIDTSSTVATPPNCATAACTSAQIAALDIAEWTEFFRDVNGVGTSGTGYSPMLPGGQGRVVEATCTAAQFDAGTCSVTGGGTFTIWVGWSEVDYDASSPGDRTEVTKSVVLTVTP